MQHAAVLLARMDFEEEALVDLEKATETLSDACRRIRLLLNLNFYYIREFGIPFEKRHCFRHQLERILLQDEPADLQQAKRNANATYDEEQGQGLPRLTTQILESWREQVS